MKLANKAAELEGTFTKRLEEKLKEVAGEGGEALLKAEKEAEELRTEVKALKMKASGVQARRHEMASVPSSRPSSSD